MFVIDNFIQRVKNTPNKTAVKFKKGDYSFQEISNISSQLAVKLDQTKSSKIIPFYLKDTRFVLPTVLGIWLSGRIPMPLVSALGLLESIDRVKEVKWDTLITDVSVEYEGRKIVQVNDLDKKIKSDFKAKQFSSKTTYILSTSGSTGVPKKVFLTEDNIKWILSKLYPLIGVDEKTKFLFSTPYSFDVSLTELLSPVIAGAELVCLPTSPSKTESIKIIPKLINNEQITHVSLSPSFAQALIDIAGSTAFSKLKFLMVAGEAFPVDLARKLKHTIDGGCKVFNLYGPTETTVYATYYQVTGNEKEYVPIGRPLPGAKVKVYDKKHRESKKGELYVGGRGVTEGYLLDPAKNNSSFININDQLYYKTGDNVKVAADGELIFLEREDDQVEINGIRVELGEVQSLVATINDIKSVVVRFKNNRIYIFYISTNNREAEIKKKIPNYISPIIIRVKHFLYTYNRKIDTQAMIDEYYKIISTKSNSDILSRLHKIINQYHVKKIEELDSLELVRFIVEVENTFKIHINDAQISLLNTIDRLAGYIERQESDSSEFSIKIREKVNKSELLNLKLLFTNFHSQYEKGKITVSSTQQSLFQQHKKSFDFLRIAMPSINFMEVEKIRQIFVDLTKKIDLLKFAWFKDQQDKLYFKKMIDPLPILFVSENELSEEDFSKVMYAKQGTPIYCLVFNINKNELDIVFSHHAIDASSSNKLKKIFVNLYQGNLSLSQVKNSSYADFMNFVKKINKKTDLKRAISLVPKTEKALNLTKNDGHLYVTKFACPGNTTDQVYIRGIYLLSQAMMKDHHMNKITGKIASNIRRFNAFDASNIIGDVHATIPWEVKVDDKLSDFANRYHEWQDIYDRGIDFRYCIFNHVGENLEYVNVLSKQWKNMNISPNYLGEVSSVKSIIHEIMQLPFKPNYITMLTKQGILYCISYGCLLQKNKYEVELDDGQKVELTTNEYEY